MKKEPSFGQPYRIQTAPSPVSDSWTGLTNSIYNGPIVITDDMADPAASKVFRAVSP